MPQCRGMWGPYPARGAQLLLAEHETSTRVRLSYLYPFVAHRVVVLGDRSVCVSPKTVCLWLRFCSGRQHRLLLLSPIPFHFSRRSHTLLAPKALLLLFYRVRWRFVVALARVGKLPRTACCEFYPHRGVASEPHPRVTKRQKSRKAQ